MPTGGFDAVLHEFLSSELSDLRELAHDIAKDVLAPATKQAERDKDVPPHILVKLAEAGLCRPLQGETSAADTPDTRQAVVIAEGLGSGDPAIALAALWNMHPTLLLARCGTPRQRADLLPRAAGMKATDLSIALYEGSGRATSESEFTIVNAGGNRWRAVGRKVAVRSVGGGGSFLLVGVDPSQDRQLRVAVVPAANDGVTVAGSTVHLGLEAARMVVLNVDTIVGADDLLRTDAETALELAGLLARHRLVVGAVAVGTARRALEYASQYAQERVAFGRPLAAFEGVAFPLAFGFARLEAASLTLWNAAASVDARVVGELLEYEVSAAVNFATQAAVTVTRACLQTLGGHGFIRDHPLERWYRGAAGLSAIDFDPLHSPLELAY